MLEKIIVFQVIYIVGMIGLVKIALKAVRNENRYKKMYESKSKDLNGAFEIHNKAKYFIADSGLMDEYIKFINNK